MSNAHKYSSRSSMDDILSSIRRIIDESVSPDSEAEAEPTRATPAPVNTDAPAEPARPSELLSNEPVTPKVTVPVNGLNGHGPDKKEPAAHDHRFTPDDAVAFREVAEVLQSTASILHTQDVDHKENASDEGVAPVVDALDDEDESAGLPPVGDLRTSPPVEITKAVKEEKKAPTQPPEPEPARDEIVPLVSTATSRSIAQTLAALDEVLKERTGEDLKSTTEEMLKPMLAEWLDENLPSMVERLVRQEIERIARGEPRAA